MKEGGDKSHGGEVTTLLNEAELYFKISELGNWHSGDQ